MLEARYRGGFFGLLPQRVPLGRGGRHDEMLRECSKHEGVYKTEHNGFSLGGSLGFAEAG